MVAPEELRDLLSDPYRVACPKGHTALNVAETMPSVYCRTCRQSYHATDDATPALAILTARRRIKYACD